MLDSKCPQCNRPFNPSTGIYTGSGLVCESCADEADAEDMDLEAAPSGIYPLGFVAGFFGGCIGLLLVHLLAKGVQTKKGATHGFIAQIVVGGLIRIIASA